MLWQGLKQARKSNNISELKQERGGSNSSTRMWKADIKLQEMLVAFIAAKGLKLFITITYSHGQLTCWMTLHLIIVKMLFVFEKVQFL